MIRALAGRWGLLLAVLPALVGGTPGRAQNLPELDALRASDFVSERELVLRAALAEERLETAPRDYATLVGAARSVARLTSIRPESDARKALAARARRHALGATSAEPDGLEGHYWLAATSGLLADVEGGRTKIRFAEQAWAESSWVLAADSAHAGAHHIQGRLHAAVMRLNRVLRFLARQLLGGEVLDQASWDAAEHHLRRAAELDATEPAHHLELGLALRDRSRPDEARRAFEAAAALEPRTPADRLYRQRARDLLGGSVAALDTPVSSPTPPA